MARICGVCKQPPREGQEMFPIRLAEEDLKVTPAVEVGLYSACLECVGAHRERVAKKRKCKVEDLSNNDLC